VSFLVLRALLARRAERAGAGPRVPGAR